MSFSFFSTRTALRSSRLRLRSGCSTAIGRQVLASSVSPQQPRTISPLSLADVPRPDAAKN